MSPSETLKRRESQPEKTPWKVEGEREDAEARKGSPPKRSGPRMPGGRRFWWFLIGLLTLNIILGQLIPSDSDKRLKVPYTFFREQVQAGNVKEVNARSDTIQGEFKREVK